nr:MAG TPA: hypothetical protein [Caudoviricetes sp.]
MRPPVLYSFYNIKRFFCNNQTFILFFCLTM